jgi:hypothetical protein
MAGCAWAEEQGASMRSCLSRKPEALHPFDFFRVSLQAGAADSSIVAHGRPKPNTDSVGELLQAPDGNCLRTPQRTLGVRWAGRP